MSCGMRCNPLMRMAVLHASVPSGSSRFGCRPDAAASCLTLEHVSMCCSRAKNYAPGKEGSSSKVSTMALYVILCVLCWP
jgi:hypothetical protein